MDVEPHKDFAAIQEAILSYGGASPWSGEVFRSATLRYARAGDMVTGLGSARMGGRWNPPGSFPTVYASLEPEAAMSESLASFRYYGWALHDAMPRVFRSLEARLGRVLDLRLAEETEWAGAWMAQIRSEDWRAVQTAGRESTSQAFGRAAWTAGVEGLLVPSITAPGKTNLVAFPGSFAPGSSIRAIR